jgi:hypothetical protein
MRFAKLRRRRADQPMRFASAAGVVVSGNTLIRQVSFGPMAGQATGEKSWFEKFETMDPKEEEKGFGFAYRFGHREFHLYLSICAGYPAFFGRLRPFIHLLPSGKGAAAETNPWCVQSAHFIRFSLFARDAARRFPHGLPSGIQPSAEINADIGDSEAPTLVHRTASHIREYA